VHHNHNTCFQQELSTLLLLARTVMAHSASPRVTPQLATPLCKQYALLCSDFKQSQG
jgi:hypothetical protein